MTRVPSGWRRFLIFLPLVCFLPYIFNVRELNQSKTFEDLRRKKYDHLVLGPAAGEGLPNRLHCQGTKALNKTDFLTPSKASSAGNNISFVTVFTIYNSSLDERADENASKLVVVGNASYSKEERSMAILNTFVNFIQVTMPESNVFVLTDPASDLSISRNGVTVYPIEGLLGSQASGAFSRIWTY